VEPSDEERGFSLVVFFRAVFVWQIAHVIGAS
jgi:hypothetical protein